MSLSIMLALGLAVGTANPSPTTTKPIVSRKLSNDRQLSTRIVAKLAGHKKAGKLRHFDLTLDVESGTVWLQGSVADAAQRRLVRNTVKRVRGVKTVIDDLKLSPKRKRATFVSRPVARPVPFETYAPPKPTLAKPEAKKKAQQEATDHHEHHGEHVDGEVAYVENWSPDGCECCGPGKLPCPFKSTCDMPLHHAYMAQPAFYYYFRPYQWTHVSLQQQEAAQYGLAPSNPYDNRFFEKIYKEVDDKIGMNRKPTRASVARRPGKLQALAPVVPARKTAPKIRVKSKTLKPLDLGEIDDVPLYRKSRRINASPVKLAPKRVTLRKPE